MSKISDTIKNQRAVYTLEINLGRSRDDGLPKKATGAILICYLSGDRRSAGNCARLCAQSRRERSSGIAAGDEGSGLSSSQYAACGRHA